MAIEWNQINANLPDATSGVNTALAGLSQAGTIFGDLRKSILDEEQRNVDNAYRERLFNQQADQFAMTYGLEKDRFGELIRQYDVSREDGNRQFDLSHALEEMKLDETVRNNRANERLRGQQISQSGSDLKQWQDAAAKKAAEDAAVIDIMQVMNADAAALTQKRNELKQIIDSKDASSEQKAAAQTEYNTIDARFNSDYSTPKQSEALFQSIAGERGFNFYGRNTPFSQAVANQEATAMLFAENEGKQAKWLQDQQNKSAELVAGITDPSQRKVVEQVVTSLKKRDEFKDVDPVLLTRSVMNSGQGGGILSKSDGERFLAAVKSEDPNAIYNNSLYQYAASNAGIESGLPTTAKVKALNDDNNALSYPEGSPQEILNATKEQVFNFSPDVFSEYIETLNTVRKEERSIEAFDNAYDLQKESVSKKDYGKVYSSLTQAQQEKVNTKALSNTEKEFRDKEKDKIKEEESLIKQRFKYQNNPYQNYSIFMNRINTEDM